MGTKDRNVLLCFGLANLECKTCAENSAFKKKKGSQK